MVNMVSYQVLMAVVAFTLLSFYQLLDVFTGIGASIAQFTCLPIIVLHSAYSRMFLVILLVVGAFTNSAYRDHPMPSTPFCMKVLGCRGLFLFAPGTNFYVSSILRYISLLIPLFLIHIKARFAHSAQTAMNNAPFIKVLGGSRKIFLAKGALFCISLAVLLLPFRENGFSISMITCFAFTMQFVQSTICQSKIFFGGWLQFLAVWAFFISLWDDIHRMMFSVFPPFISANAYPALRKQPGREIFTFWEVLGGIGEFLLALCAAFQRGKIHFLTPLVSALIAVLPGSQGHFSSQGFMRPTLGNISILPFLITQQKAEMEAL
jgi:hypothetical protein